MSTKIASFALALLAFGTTAASADDYSNASAYNHGYGASAGEENQAANPSLRDANGNLTVVNGQFTSSSVSQNSGMQMSASGAQLQGLGNGGGSGAGYAGATAIGNQLNVVTVGNFNTVVVNSHQNNTGTVTATTTTNGSN